MRPIPAAAMIALVSGGLLAACAHSADPGQLAAVERLIGDTGNMNAELNNQDTAALAHMSALFEAERPAIGQRLRDTLLPREAEVLGNYFRAMNERLPLLIDERRAQQARLDSTARRLRNLRHDMEQGLMGKSKRRQALEMEQQWNVRLHQDLDSLAARTMALLHERRTYRAAIDSQLHP